MSTKATSLLADSDFLLQAVEAFPSCLSEPLRLAQRSVQASAEALIYVPDKFRKAW